MISWKALEWFGKLDKKSLMAGVVYGQGLKGRALAAQNPAPAGFPQGLWETANRRAAAMIAAMRATEASGAEPETPDEEPFDKEAFCVGTAIGRSLEGWEIDGTTNLPDGWAKIIYYVILDSPSTVTIWIGHSGLTRIDWGDSTTDDDMSSAPAPYSHDYGNGGAYIITVVSNRGIAPIAQFASYGALYGRYAGVYSNTENPRGILRAAHLEGKASLGANGYAFRYCENLTSITINGAQSIPAHTFEHCEKLSSVVLSHHVKTIGSYAFACCKSLQNILIPDSVETIYDGAFCQCGLTSVTIPANRIIGMFSSFWDGKYTLDGGAFSLCENLKSVIIKGRSIGQRTFMNCPNLKSVTIAASVTNIDRWAFSIGSYSTFVDDVYYSGTKEQWEAITIDSNNQGITSTHTTIHYNSTGPDDVHDD